MKSTGYIREKSIEGLYSANTRLPLSTCGIVSKLYSLLDSLFASTKKQMSKYTPQREVMRIKED